MISRPLIIKTDVKRYLKVRGASSFVRLTLSKKGCQSLTSG